MIVVGTAESVSEIFEHNPEIDLKASEGKTTGKAAEGELTIENISF